MTEQGIELLDGTCVVEKSRLADQPDYPWPQHIGTESWVDVAELTTAWMVPLLLQGFGEAWGREQLLDVFAKLPPPVGGGAA